MNKNTYETVKLAKGEMHVYDFGAVKLHAYQTNDPIACLPNKLVVQGVGGGEQNNQLDGVS